jgi:hypothetical protein
MDDQQSFVSPAKPGKIGGLNGQKQLVMLFANHKKPFCAVYFHAAG